MAKRKSKATDSPDDLRAEIVLQYATLKTMVDNLAVSVGEINAKLDAWIPKVMTQDEAAQFAKQLQEKAARLKDLGKS